MANGLARYVGFAFGRYAKERPLARAVPDTEALARVLAARHGYDCKVIADPTSYEIRQRVDETLAENSLTGGLLVVSWIGHARPGPGGGLELLGRRSQEHEEDAVVADARDLGRWAARTGAAQTLVVIDTCFSAGGVGEASGLANAIIAGRSDPGYVWFCVLAASLADERARSGALAARLEQLLTSGPAEPGPEWTALRDQISGQDLVEALLAEWSEDRQRPIHQATGGRSRGMFGNPCRRDVGAAEPDERLLFAARGGSLDRSYFAGRREPLQSVIAWVRSGEPGLGVITGPPGCGKTALLGRVLSLASETERARLLEQRSIEPGVDLDGAHFAAVIQAHRVTTATMTADLARQLGVDPDGGMYAVLAEARHRRNAGVPLLVAIDGLDEAYAMAPDVATEIVVPLAAESRVLISTRDLAPAGSSTTSLVGTLGLPALLVDLGEDHDATRADVSEYVIARLDGVDARMNPEAVADALVAQIGRYRDSGPFLLASLVTAQLRQSPVDTDASDWKLALATSVESALEDDLEQARIAVDGRPDAPAARRLLTALALAEGAGFPSDDVWPAVANALAPGEAVLDRHHVYELLMGLGRHIVSGAERDQQVFRLAHRLLADYLRRPLGGEELMPDVASAVAKAIADDYRQYLAAGFGPQQHAYLWRYAWVHLSQAGDVGVDLLRSFVAIDPDAFGPDLASALERVSSRSALTGHPAEAIAPALEAVELRKKQSNNVLLSDALLNLASVYTIDGNQGLAEEATSEALSLAEQLRDTPDGGVRVAAALIRRAAALLQRSQFDDVVLLADRAAELLREGHREPGVWVHLAAAHTLGAEALAQKAGATFDGSLGASVERRVGEALSIIEEFASDERHSFEPLGPLAVVQLLAGLQRAAIDRTVDIQLPAAERALGILDRLGPSGTLGDLGAARLLLLLGSAEASNHSRGIGSGRESRCRDLLDRAHLLVQAHVGSPLGLVMQADIVLARGQMKGIQWWRAEGAEAMLAMLERVAPGNDLAATQLGALLDARTAAWLGGEEGDERGLGEVIQCQRRAVSLLARHATGTERRIAALQRLLTLTVRAGDLARELEARDEMIALLRSGIAASPGRDLALAIQLSEFAGRAGASRSVEAMAAATEALEMIDRLVDPPVPRRWLTGVTKVNLGVCHIVAERSKEAIAAFESALTDLETVSHMAPVIAAAATARNNLAVLRLQAGDAEGALGDATLAQELADSATMPPESVELPLLIRVNAGLAYRALGRDGEAKAMLGPAIDSLVARLSEEGASVQPLAYALNVGTGGEAWDAILAQLADRPTAAARLRRFRQRSPTEADATVEDLLTSLSVLPSTDARATREVARGRRHSDPDAIDDAWRRATGEVPSWLVVDPALSDQVIAWYNTPDLRSSCDYLARHPELLDPATDLLLDEFNFDNTDVNDQIGFHHEILSAARTVGVVAAYAEWLVRDELDRWVKAEDTEHYLAEHAELLRPAVIDLLQSDSDAGDLDSTALLGLLDFAARGEQALAHEILERPLAAHSRVCRAWRSDNPRRLRSLAALVAASNAGTDPDAAWAILAVAASWALEGRQELAQATLDVARSRLGDAAVEPLVDLLVDVIRHHPDHAADIGALLAGLGGETDDDETGGEDDRDSL